ncbi:hypothetical protein KGR20_23265, partial [Cytobacillus oceanisediminis]|uniref:hypothetical protein n=1 Tax=Cytobacillus oceanisediminis TaxID=665099 RepID=UPI001CCF0AA4
TLLGARGAPQHCPIPLVGKNLIVIVLTIYCNSIIYTKYFTFPTFLPNFCFISKPGDFSAKLPFYQPKSTTFQPNFCFISQNRRLFSQTSVLSAKPGDFSAKLPFYQPKSVFPLSLT